MQEVGSDLGSASTHGTNASKHTQVKTGSDTRTKERGWGRKEGGRPAGFVCVFVCVCVRARACGKSDLGNSLLQNFVGCQREHSNRVRSPE